jgi:hypothetical protein
MYLPAYLNQRDAPLPDPDGVPARCVVADNGIFLERRSPMYTTSVRVSPHKLGLGCHDEYCRLTCGRIPPVLQRAMLSFFLTAHTLHGGEAALVLLYHPRNRTFRWHCPEQVVDIYPDRSGWVAGDVIKYANPVTLPPGYVHFGDAHLHVGPPTPSAIDIGDDEDGLHIIVGTVKSKPTYHVDFVMDRARFRIPPEAIFDDPHCLPFVHTSPRWLDRIRLRASRNVEASTHPLVDIRRFTAPAS